MIKKIDKNFFVFGAISLAIIVFYCFYINFSIDTIILFLSNKIFLGKWLAQGVFPWFNPHIFLGTPYAFDVGIGSFHPFNLFFLLPYPYSFAVWMGATSFLFLSGFYLLFRSHTKTRKFALLLNLILFFSGTGIFRASNPTILLVIAHIGLFAFSLQALHHQNKTREWAAALGVGICMTLSGHVQFVLYGYIFAVLYLLLFWTRSFKTLIRYFCWLFLLTSWYFVFSLPLVFESTRLTSSKDYITTGNNNIFQYFELILPYVFGYVQNGSKWGPGPLYTILISLFFVPLFLFAVVKQSIPKLATFLILFLASLGFINFPFFRGAGQATIFLHIFGLLSIAQEEKYVITQIAKNKYLQKFALGAIIVSIGVALLVLSRVFTSSFITLYTKLKHGQVSLFFDIPTVQAIGGLFLQSMVHFALIALVIILFKKNKYFVSILSFLVIIEGIVFLFFHSYFIPTHILTNTLKQPYFSQNYRVQTASDVVPYFGLATYMGDSMFQPPFSKEKPVFDKVEASTLSKLRTLFNFYPLSWNMTLDQNSVQGYSTFLNRDLASEFASPSPDFREEYKYIIDRNPLFAENKQDTSINSISSGHLTLTDPRWEKLGVRYFISDRPLKKYKLIEKNNGRYIYENEWAPPIYRVVKGDIMTAKQPTYQNPNEWHFDISNTESGSDFEMVMNPGGFVATLNGKPVAVHKEKFLIRVPLAAGGKLIVRYSPVEHLKETIAGKVKFQLFK